MTLSSYIYCPHGTHVVPNLCSCDASCVCRRVGDCPTLPLPKPRPQPRKAVPPPIPKETKPPVQSREVLSGVGMGSPCSRCGKKGLGMSGFFVLLGKVWCSMWCCEIEVVRVLRELKESVRLVHEKNKRLEEDLQTLKGWISRQGR